MDARIRQNIKELKYAKGHYESLIELMKGDDIFVKLNKAIALESIDLIKGTIEETEKLINSL